MKVKWTATIMASIFCLQLGTAALARVTTVDRTAPFAGQYLLTVNNSHNPTSKQNSGTLQSSVIAPQALKTMEQIESEEYIKLQPVRLAPSVTKVSTVRTRSLVRYVTNQEKRFVIFEEENRPYHTYHLTATLRYAGTYCTLWVDNADSANITNAKLAAFAKKFDEQYFGFLRDNFGVADDVDGDGKVAILFHDIHDDFNPPYYNGYTAGYFDPIDYHSVQETGLGETNHMDMIHLDTYPALGDTSNPDLDRALTTLVHEYTHLIVYSEAWKSPTQMEPLELWLNEGLAMSAENIVSGISEKRIEYYNASAGVRDGAVLAFTDYAQNEDPENPGYMDIMADYSLPYLFMQYLRTQTDDTIYKEILESSFSDYRAVQSALLSFGQEMSFATVHQNFRIALVCKDQSGPYGFMGETDFDAIKPRICTKQNVNLAGSGAVVTKINGLFTEPEEHGTKIAYIGFAPPKPLVFGDASGDGLVSSDDIIAMKKHIAGLSVLTGDCLEAADYTQDGLVDSSDIIAVKKVIAGLA